MTAVTVGSLATVAVLGALSWTLLEYLLHRFAMHVMRGRGMASREHLTHHARVDYFTSNAQKAMTAGSVGAVALPTAWLLTNGRFAIAWVAGLLGAYLAYEVLHRRAHTHAPATAYGRWLRKHHLAHHFTSPMRNFGVTTPVWDMLFRTRIDPEVVRVPRRLAMVWLADTDGTVRPELADDYILIGRDRSGAATTELDVTDAFANRVPAPA